MNKIMQLIGVCGVSFFLLYSSFAFAQPQLSPKSQPQFVNPLPIPTVIDGRNGGIFTISVSQFDQWLGLVEPATGKRLTTTVWGYNSSYPGPTILAKKNIPIRVFWRNDLVNKNNQPLPHLLPIDRSIDWALADDPNWEKDGVPIITHLHGGHTESASDGLPNQWFTPGYRLKGAGFIKGDVDPFYYGNDQEAATIWYHDHAMGVTRLNVYAGLAGYYLITDDNEHLLQALNKLPASPYDLGLAIQDRMFTSNGQLLYPSQSDEDETLNPSLLPEIFGDFILVNGMASPYLEVEPRQYRFRILNGSDSRFYNLFLSSGQPFIEIGSDQGLLPSPYVTDQLLIAPGERKDVILDFSNPALLGQTIIVKNNAKTPYPKGEAPDPVTAGRVMAFRITKPLNTNYLLTAIPSTLRPPIAPLKTSLPARKLILFETTDEHGRIMPVLGTTENGFMHSWDSITENPMLNSTEVWEFYNETMDAHPIHLHQVKMQLISRQKFQADINEQTGKPDNIRMIGQPKYPAPDEQGWKDTWIMYPGEVTRVIANFDLPGLYVWHCHILSHEEHDMMRPFFVGEMNNNMTVKKMSAIDNEKSAAAVQLKLMPNPFSNYVTIQLYFDKAKKLAIDLFDEKGSLVRKVYEGVKDAGLNHISIDGGNLTNGVYFCRICVNEEVFLRKLVLQK